MYKIAVVKMALSILKNVFECLIKILLQLMYGHFEEKRSKFVYINKNQR